jgi:hypothetical protein
MTINKVTYFVVISLLVVNISFGAGWRITKTLIDGADSYCLDMTTDNHYIHIASGYTFGIECAREPYFNSPDGILWGNLHYLDPGMGVAGTGTPPCLLSNQFGIHAIWRADRGPQVKHRYSPDYGINWEDWQDIGTGSNDVAVAGFSDITYSFWSDVRIINEPDNRELYFKKSEDGQNWWSYEPDPLDGAQRLTFADGISSNPSSSINNYGIHLVWADNRGNDPNNYEIWYKYSTDDGQHWSEDVPLTVNQTDSSFYPAITTYNNGVHVVFQDKRYETNQIFYKRSLDNGQNWAEEYVLADGIRPDISVDEYGLHVVYEYDGEIYYRQSSNYGNSWSDPINISTDTVYSTTAKIYTDFRGRHIAWVSMHGYGNIFTPIMYRQYDILPPGAPQNFRIKYITELKEDLVEVCLDWIGWLIPKPI